MIGAGALRDLVTDDDRAPKLCAWPDACDRRATWKGLCTRHAMKIHRGGRLGCETTREELAVAALALWNASSEADGDKAFERALDALEDVVKGLVERRLVACAGASASIATRRSLREQQRLHRREEHADG